jgi:hypothetical protein
MVHLARTGPAQPFYRFAAVSLTDSAGHIFGASSANYGTDLTASFDVSSASPGLAKITVIEEGGTPVQTATLFIEPRHPAVSLYCGLGDRELRVTGSDAGLVKSVQVGALSVAKSDDSDPAYRKLIFTGALPQAVKAADVTYHDPGTGLEWTRPVPVAVGLPRPDVSAQLTGDLPTTLPVGVGADPTWAMATLPPGWFATCQPVRIKLQAVKPYAWSHDTHLELGIGSVGDVQPIVQLQEGPTFAMDEDSPDAYVTLTFDTNLPENPKRTSGLLWFQLTRSDLSSPWIQATTSGAPLRSVKVPQILSVESLPGKTRVTLAKADETLGVRFAGRTDFAIPQLVRSEASGLIATVDGPAGVSEFDVKVRDAGDAFIHIKIGHAAPMK